MNKIIIFTALAAFLLISCTSNTKPHEQEKPELIEQGITFLKIENLLSD